MSSRFGHQSLFDLPAAPETGQEPLLAALLFTSAAEGVSGTGISF